MENINKMPHIKFKPTKRFDIDFNPRELDKIEVPEESKIVARKYLKSNELYDGAIMLLFENEVIFGFDYLYQNKKLAIPEINPVTIFFSNAVMSPLSEVSRLRRKKTMKKTIHYMLTILLFSLVSCKNYYNETIDWANSLVIETEIEMVKMSQPDFVEIDWQNPLLMDGQEYYEIENKNNRDILQMQNFLVFENKKYKGREAKK